MDRFARRRRRQDASGIVGIDRDKTLEPRDSNENGDDEGSGGLNPLMKSATTSNLGLFKNSRLKNSGSFGNSDRKERTPFRLTRNKTSRYLVDSDGRDNTHYRTRYYEPGGSGRYRENAPDASSRLNRSDKENYKSRYDPDALSDDLSSSTRRQRTYGRTKTLTDLLNGDDAAAGAASTSYTSPSTSSSSRVNRFDANQRKSLGTALQRSRTNAYLYEDPNNIQFDDEDRSSADNAAILAALREDNNETAANAFVERLEKRKVVKNMLIKYAEDDSYDQNKNDDTASVVASTNSSNSSTNRRSKKKDSSGTIIPSTSSSSYKRMDGVGPLFYDPPVSTSSYRKPLTSKTSNVYDNSVINSRFLPLTKSATSSSLSLLGNRQPQTSSYLYQQRSRIPKTLSSFVRHFLCLFYKMFETFVCAY